MYDISKINSPKELQALIDDLEVVIKDKKADPKVKTLCVATRTEAMKKLKLILKNNGL